MENIKEEQYMIWLYTYEPLDKNYSYNAIIKPILSKQGLYIFCNLGALDIIDDCIRDLNKEEVFKIICKRIDELFEGVYDV